MTVTILTAILKNAKINRRHFDSRNLNAAELAEPRCAEPDRLADHTWSSVKSLEFACKPKITVKIQDAPHIFGR